MQADIVALVPEDRSDKRKAESRHENMIDQCRGRTVKLDESDFSFIHFFPLSPQPLRTKQKYEISNIEQGISNRKSETSTAVHFNIPGSTFCGSKATLHEFIG